jgi:activator of 2-hydroxyglutaryl-CoA dehydratase
MNWLFEGMSMQDIARGIYISIANKVAKMRLDPGIPTYMIGGVIQHHPYLKELLNEKFKKDIKVVDGPQYLVSYGAAIIAMQGFSKPRTAETENAIKKIKL